MIIFHLKLNYTSQKCSIADDKKGDNNTFDPYGDTLSLYRSDFS